MCDYWDFRVGGVLSLKTDNTTPDQAFILRVLQMAKSREQIMLFRGIFALLGAT